MRFGEHLSFDALISPVFSDEPTMEIKLSGEDVPTVFALNGLDENSATYALGWVLFKSPTFCEYLVKDLSGFSIDPEFTNIELQKFSKGEGVTDLEITCPGVFHLIIEAKVNWVLPGQDQLLKYAGRIISNPIGPGTIASLSGASQAYAIRNQPNQIKNLPLNHRSWSDIRHLINKTLETVSSHEEKGWLRQLNQHLKEYVSMQKVGSNSVYVVSLSRDPAGNNLKYSYVDVIEKDNSYFHPIRKKWPVTPPKLHWISL